MSLYRAAVSGNLPLVQELLREGASCDVSVMTHAVTAEQMDVVMFLHTHTDAKCGVYALFWALKNKRDGIATWLVQNRPECRIDGMSTVSISNDSWKRRPSKFIKGVAEIVSYMRLNDVDYRELIRFMLKYDPRPTVEISTLFTDGILSRIGHLAKMLRKSRVELSHVRAAIRCLNNAKTTETKRLSVVFNLPPKKRVCLNPLVLE